VVAASALLIEQLAVNAWPAATVQLVDGWLLRHTPAVARRRSNSALPPLARPGPALPSEPRSSTWPSGSTPAVVSPPSYRSARWSCTANWIANLQRGATAARHRRR
jgi:hypothetical protein